MKAVVTALAVGAGLLTAMPGAAVAAPNPYLQAVQRDLGLSAEQATRRITQEASAIELQAGLTAVLGTSFAGSWFDPATGALTVAVTDEPSAKKAREAGARATVMSRNLAQLDAVKAEFDRLGGTAGIAATRIDPRTNSVVVTVVAGRHGPAVATAAGRHGSAVRIEEIPAAPTTTWEFLEGGEQAGDCSVGFNAQGPDGRYRMLTAGHCAEGNDSVAGWNGVTIGKFVLVKWRDGNDYAATSVNNWHQGPWVSNYGPPGDGTVLVYGSNPAAVGMTVCKSGVTTRWTCGVITGMNETVHLYGGGVIDGLTRHTACAEPGDSGGSNMSGEQAQGVSSAATLVDLRWCLEKYGQQNVSWFQPVGEILANEGYTLMTV